MKKFKVFISSDQKEKFKITRDTANRDFNKLMKLRLIEQKGTGRGTYYIFK